MPEATLHTCPGCGRTIAATPPCSKCRKKRFPICQESYDTEQDPYHLENCRDSTKP